MRKFLCGLSLLIVICSSCKKAVENRTEELLMKLITDGTWIVEQYVENEVNVTSQFSGYDFKFRDDGTVTGNYSGNSTRGTWSGNLSEKIIVSEFKDANDPLKKLNGTWKVKDSGLDFVKAESSSVAPRNVLHLKKKS